VFVRGYGLVDSPRVTATPGQALDLKAAVAPDARAAAEVYPANYWLALARVPPGPEPPGEIIREVKGCMSCHQIGDKATREIPAGLGTFRTSLEAWDYRVRTGPSGQGMSNNYKALGAQRTMFADWTDRIAAGEFPKEAPPRPTGVERNLVVSLWDWGTGTSFTHTPASGPFALVTMPPMSSGSIATLTLCCASTHVNNAASRPTSASTLTRRFTFAFMWSRLL